MPDVDGTISRGGFCEISLTVDPRDAPRFSDDAKRRSVTVYEVNRPKLE